MLSWLTRRPRFGPLEPWQRDQYVVISTVALAHIAFDLTQPFIPLYVHRAGRHRPGGRRLLVGDHRRDRAARQRD